MASEDVSVVADSKKEEENLDVDSSKDKNKPENLDLSTEKTDNVNEKAHVKVLYLSYKTVCLLLTSTFFLSSFSAGSRPP